MRLWLGFLQVPAVIHSGTGVNSASHLFFPAHREFPPDLPIVS